MSSSVQVPDVLHVVSCRYGISVVELLSRRRRHALARQIAMWLASQCTGATMPEIGWFMGDRDRTTVAHGVARIEELMWCDTQLAGELRDLRGTLLAACADG